MRRIAAWAHATSSEETIRMCRELNIGAVLNAGNYEAALLGDGPWYARVESIKQAEDLASIVERGGIFRAAIVKDELNMTGLSGAYMTPEAYAVEYKEISGVLRSAGVPVSTMALAWIGSRGVWPPSVFDADYHWKMIKLTNADYRGMNPSNCYPQQVTGVLDGLATSDTPWIVSPHPYRFTWGKALNWLLERFRGATMPFWISLADRDDVEVVAIWSLREHKYNATEWQAWHSLFDRHGNLTSLGRELRSVRGET